MGTQEPISLLPLQPIVLVVSLEITIPQLVQGTVQVEVEELFEEQIEITPKPKPFEELLAKLLEEQIEVEIGDSAGELVAVRGDLAEGDRVAIRGAENLLQGADVRILVSEIGRASCRERV